MKQSMELKYVIFGALLGFGIGLLIANGVLEPHDFVDAKLIIGGATGVGGVIGRWLSKRDKNPTK